LHLKNHFGTQMKKRLFAVAAILLIFISCDQSDKKASMKTSDSTSDKLVIYQVMTRLFGNTQKINVKYGTREQNGVGKFNDFSSVALSEIKKMGITHVWYTGVLEHAVMADYTEFGIEMDDPDVVKGRAGSPYAIKDYYDVNPDLAIDVSNRLEEFKQLIQRTHDARMKVIIDFVPNHVARKYISDAKPDGIEDFGAGDDLSSPFQPNNNFYYIPDQEFRVPEDYEPIPGFSFPGKDGRFNEVPAKATGNDKFEAQPSVHDWFETVKLNYGVDYENGRSKHFEPIPDTWIKMKDILVYWARMGVDGFRCDMAEMVPVEFWGWVIPQVEAVNPEIVFIAEIYNPQQYENYISNGNFSYLYDKVELYDTLRHILEGHGSTNNISSIVKEFDQQKISDQMLRFMENHDEQRLASRFFAGDPWKAWPSVVLSATISNGPMMIYFGQEVGEPGLGEEGFQGDDGRTTIFDYWGVPEHQKWMNEGKFDGGMLSEDQKILRRSYANLLNALGKSMALASGQMIDLHNFNLNASDGYKHDKVYSFVKSYGGNHVLIICSFADAPESLGIKLPVPFKDLRWTSKQDLISGKTVEVEMIENDLMKIKLSAHQVIMIQTQE